MLRGSLAIPDAVKFREGNIRKKKNLTTRAESPSPESARNASSNDESDVSSELPEARRPESESDQSSQISQLTSEDAAQSKSDDDELQDPKKGFGEKRHREQENVSSEGVIPPEPKKIRLATDSPAEGEPQPPSEDITTQTTHVRGSPKATSAINPFPSFQQGYEDSEAKVHPRGDSAPDLQRHSDQTKSSITRESSDGSAPPEYRADSATLAAQEWSVDIGTKVSKISQRPTGSGAARSSVQLEDAASKLREENKDRISEPKIQGGKPAPIVPKLEVVVPDGASCAPHRQPEAILGVRAHGSIKSEAERVPVSTLADLPSSDTSRSADQNKSLLSGTCATGSSSTVRLNAVKGLPWTTGEVPIPRAPERRTPVPHSVTVACDSSPGLGYGINPSQTPLRTEVVKHVLHPRGG